MGSSRSARWLPIALVACLVGAPFARELLSWRGRPRAEAHAMAIVRADVARHANVRHLLICSDPRSPEARSRFMTEFHHAHTYDQAIADAGVAPAYQTDGISLRVTDDVRALRARLQPPAAGGRGTTTMSAAPVK